MDQPPGLGVCHTRQLCKGMLDESDMPAQQGPQYQGRCQARIHAQLLDKMLGIMSQARLVDQIHCGALPHAFGDLDGQLRRQGVPRHQSLHGRIGDIGNEAFRDAQRQMRPRHEGIHHVRIFAEIRKGALVGGRIKTRAIIGRSCSDGAGIA